MTAKPVMNISAFLDQLRFGPFQWRVTLLCAAVAMLDGYDTQSIGFVAPLIAASWGVQVASFGPVFAAGLAGLAVGALVTGPIADRTGRKVAAIACTILIGVFASLTGFARDFNELLALRFLTGLGLGGVMPNVITLTSEYAPTRHRATVTSLMFCGFPIGAVLGGFIAAWLAAEFGWQSVFFVGGLLPLLLVPVLVVALPESLRFLVARHHSSAPLLRLLRRIDPALQVDATTKFTSTEADLPGLPVRHLFRDGRMLSTILLWAVFFMNLLILYFLSNWLPTVLREAGLPIQRAILATILLYVGGIVGTVVMAPWIDRQGAFVPLAWSYAGATVAIAALGSLGPNLPLVMLTVFITGFCVIGAQISIIPLASGTYPTAVRATGVGWAFGIGRIGSIVGPLVGGLLLTAGFAIPTLFFITAVPAAIAVGCILLLRVTAYSAVEQQQPAE